jgi:hypothetical protein
LAEGLKKFDEGEEKEEEKTARGNRGKTNPQKVPGKYH